MYPQVAAPENMGSCSLIRARDEKILSMRVTGSYCWFRWFLSGIVLILGSILCVVFIILDGTNLYDAASRTMITGVIFVIIGLSTKYMILEADEEQLEVTFGPCSTYQNVLCCAKCCCCDSPLSRGQLKFGHIRQVSITPGGGCRDGYGISKRKYEPTCVHSVICCPEHVVEVHQEGGPTGCCGAGRKLRYVVATHDQAVELQTFLASRAPAVNNTMARNSGTINGPVNTVATAPPSYDAIAVSPAYTLPPSTLGE